MREDDVQLGKPIVVYKDTKANIEALTSVVQGSYAYATDTDEPGWYDGSNWQWFNPLVCAGELYASGTNVVTANSITLAAGTATSGAVADTRTLNETYYVVQETAKFDIQYIFTGLTGSPRIVNFVGRYEGNPAHDVWIYAWDFNLSSWTRLTAAAQDFPSSSTDAAFVFEFPSNVTDFISAGETRVRIYHDSAAVGSHYFYTDYIAIQTQTMTLTTPGTFYAASSLSEGVESNTTLDGASGTITVDVAGIYHVGAQVSFSGTSGMTIDCHIFVNGTKVDKLGFVRTLGNATSYGSASITGLYSFSASDVVTIRGSSDIPNSWSSIDQLNLNVTRVN